MPLCRASLHIPMDQRGEIQTRLYILSHKPKNMPLRPPHRLTWPYISLAIAIMLLPEQPPKIIPSNYDFLDLIATKYGTIHQDPVETFEMVSQKKNSAKKIKGKMPEPKRGVQKNIR